MINTMNEEKLIKLLEKHFPSKSDFVGFKKEFVDFKIEMYDFRKEMKEELKNINQLIERMDDNLKELKPSSKALDMILEKHPLERIERIEKHVQLPTFVPAINLEE